MIYISGADIVLKDRILKKSSLLTKGSKIAAIGGKVQEDAELINARGLYLSPGFIDIHIHGDPEDIIRNETKYGTTSFVVAVSCGRPVPDISGYSSVLGVRIEGPYINAVMAGAQNKYFIKKPSPGGLGRIMNSCGRKLKMMTLAPETSGAEKLIGLCRKCGVIPSIGHSNASYEEAKRSFSCGIRHATHLFNAMSGPRHGTIGASLAALFDKRVTVEVIADLKHVSAALLRLVFAVKDINRIILVTDSVRAPSSGHKTGSVISMMGAVKNAVTHCGVPLPDAVRMASTNPAWLFGAGKRKGSIVPGKDADLVAFDRNFNVKFTIIGGRMVYQKKGFKARCAG